MVRFHLDPRTKILLLILVTAIVLGGAGGNSMEHLLYVLTMLPILLLVLSNMKRTALLGTILIGAGYIAHLGLATNVKGTLGFITLLIVGILVRILPGILMGKYVVETTTVSEFIAAFEKMHIPQEFTIPLSVMFRFFPTVKEEFQAIHAAMRMRDIRFGGKKVMKQIEYRMVPMLICSVKIGEELSASALSRGLGGTTKRTNICKIGFEWCDYLCLAFSLFCVLYGICTSFGVMK